MASVRESQPSDFCWYVLILVSENIGISFQGITDENKVSQINVHEVLIMVGMSI